ncbi:MAG: NAD(+) synthase [Oscillospiraceae bacterium]|nr:NAD(+) synthase [Oscillospiraceae bacterium]
MFDYIRVSCCVPNIAVADVAGNAGKIGTQMRKAAEQGTSIAVFPELCLTGYTCQDLFFQQTLLDDCGRAAQELAALSGELQITAVIGMPVSVCGQIYNCAVVLDRGTIAGIVPKHFLPNYGEYYEKRWFSSAEDLPEDRVLEVTLGDQRTAFGRNMLFRAADVSFGVELCEDLWTPLPPSTFLSLGGAELMLNLSASNETISKRAYRRSLVAQQSARCLCAYAYCSAGCTESTQDLVFSGHSLIAENGSILAENEKLLDTNYILTMDVDLGKVRADRRKNRSFADTARVYGQACICSVELAGRLTSEVDGSLYPVRKLPFVPSTRLDRQNRCRDIFQMQVAGLIKRLSVTNAKPVIGVSGGLDSTLALLVSAEAVRQMDRPLTDVIGITMPCFGTTDRTYNNALELMRTMGITSVTIPIASAVEQHFLDIGHDKSVTDLTFENSQARERTQVLMDYAGKVGGLVVGTGDLSELALGWCTYNADHMSMYGVNASIPKTLIRWMIDALVEYDIFPESTEVLRDVLDTPISPELLPPDAEGNIAQQTEDIVGPYALHDFFLYYVLRYGFTPEKIFSLALRAFRDDFDRETVLKWLRNFYRRFVYQQFKRSCLPDGVKVGSVCLSPRGDWRMPSDASAASWLSRVEKL